MQPTLGGYRMEQTAALNRFFRARCSVCVMPVADSAVTSLEMIAQLFSRL